MFSIQLVSERVKLIPQILKGQLRKGRSKRDKDTETYILFVNLACLLAGGSEAKRLLQVTLINPTTHLFLAGQAEDRCHVAIGGSG